MPKYTFKDDHGYEFTYSPEQDDVRRALAEIYYEHYFKKVWQGDRTTIIHALEHMIDQEELDYNEDILDYWHDELQEYFEEDAFEEYD